MHIREVAPTELACCMRSCVRPVRLIQSWLLRKRARSQRCSFESPSVAYDSPEHCQSTKHGSTSNRTTSQKIKVRVYPITCPLCKGLVTSERMGGTADVRVRNMGTISSGPFSHRPTSGPHGPLGASAAPGAPPGRECSTPAPDTPVFLTL